VKVELTWEYKGKFTKEICDLADYDAVLRTFEGDPVPDDVAERIKKEGFVMFEDDDGVFCLRTTQIKDIKPL
jgi:hypothetical protein